MDDNVLLVGMMGSGKTTVGRLLAARLGRVFRDSDEEICERTGMTVQQIFESQGEPAFRAQERAVLAVAIAAGPPAVIAVAGGAVIDPESRRRIRRGGAVLWLDASPSVLAARVGHGTGRPLLEHDAGERLRLLDARRRPVYRSLADATMNVDGVLPRLIAERAERLARDLLGARLSCRKDGAS